MYFCCGRHGVSSRTLASGLTWLGLAATAAALVAAFLNGVFGFCLGCEMCLLIRRFRPGRQALGADRSPQLIASVVARQVMLTI